MKGYKGFKKGLISDYNNFQYKEGEIFEWEPSRFKNTISLCSSGFHFSSQIQDVFNFYSHDHKKHDFCEVEALGKILTGSDKSCTDKIKIIRLLSPEEVDEIYRKEKEGYEDKKVYCLDVVQHLQKKYMFAIGGSVALYLNGYKLKREANQIDFDVIVPFYQKIVPDKIIEGAEEFDAKTSGNDFSLTYAITTHDGRFLKLDVKIDNKQRYDIVKYKDVEYYTSKLFDILEAKVKYAKEGNMKHKEDVLHLLKTPVKNEPLPF